MSNKKYSEFTSGVPASGDITLYANPTTGVLKKTPIGLTYSTEEQETKDTDIDGKKIMCKSFDIGNGTNDVYALEGITTDRVENIIDVRTRAYNAIDGSFSLFTPELSLDDTQWQIFTTITNNRIISTVWYTLKD